MFSRALIYPPTCSNAEPGRRIELLSPDYKAGALPLSYPGRRLASDMESMHDPGHGRHDLARSRV